MSLIGTLEYIPLTSVLLGLETHAKTGLLVVKHGASWVELYFRDGRLMCIGPVRTDASLGDRLLHDGVISAHALQEVLLALGTAPQGETRIALTLMDLGFVSREELRNWGTKKAIEVLQVLLSWSEGEIYFEDQVQTPPERLLVALSVQSLLPSIASMPPLSQTPPVPPTPPTARAQQQDVSAATQGAPRTIPLAPQQGTLSSASLVTLTPESPFSQSLKEMSPVAGRRQQPPMPALPERESIQPSAAHDPLLHLFESSPANASPSTESLLPVFRFGDVVEQRPAVPPTPVQVLVPPKQVDTSFLRPDTVLIPADLSAFRTQNAQVQLFPEHWRLLTRVNGNTTLQAACQELGMLPEMICQLAAELIALGLLHVSPASSSSYEPMPRELVATGPFQNQLASGLYATGSSLPAPDIAMQFSPSSFETQSQWGNGGNGAKFIPGRGWITGPQPLQPLEHGGSPSLYSGSYSAVGGR